MKTQMKILALVAVVLSFTNASTAIADDDVIQDSGSWLQVVAEGNLKAIDPSLEKTRLWVEGQSRFNNDFDHWYQGMVRTAVGYSLSDRATIWAGYTWLPTQNIGKQFVSQQDVWPAFRYVLPTEMGTFMFRTMIESNFLGGNEVRVRPRQMVKFTHPLEFEPRLSLVMWDEAFVRTNTTQYGGKSGFDQNRAFAGLGWTFNSSIRTELGYMNHYFDDTKHIDSTMRHLVMGSLFFSF